jgi:hypothetical protein
VVLVGFNAFSTGVANAGNTARAESSINRMQVRLGEWLAQNTPKDAVIACNDVGAIGYFSGRRVLDLLGLVTPEVVSYRKKYPLGSENYGALDFIKDKKPDYLAIFPGWFPNLKDAQFLQPVLTVEVTDNTASQYEFSPVPRTLAGILVTGLPIEPLKSTTVVYKCDWSKLQQ